MDDKYYMNLAIQLALSARGQTAPNPLVGAIIVKNGEIVGMGAHLKAGEAHAETLALRIAGEKAKGSVVYVTLEPCSHHGKTPPCANALIEAGVRKVVIADSFDPDSRVSGKGIQLLKDAGIEVLVGVEQEKAVALNEVFKHFVKTKKPFVTLKAGTTLDGKIATVTRDSRWVTEKQARIDVHQLRHVHDVILVGVGTILADNPKLTTRLPAGGKNPIRVILDSHLRIPLHSNVLRDLEAPTWIFTTDYADREKWEKLNTEGIEIFSTGKGRRVNIERMLKKLAERQISSVLVEGGSEVHWEFLKQKAFQKIVTYISPKIIGGKTAPTFIGGEGLEWMNEAIKITRLHVQMVGEDIKITGYPLFE